MNRFAMSMAVLASVLGLAALLIWVERRLLGLWQERFGPNRVGPLGMFQSVADMIKIFTKEDWIPPFADKQVFVLAPTIVVIATLMTWNYLVNAVSYHVPFVERLDSSPPLQVVRDGRLLRRNMRREFLTVGQRE